MDDSGSTARWASIFKALFLLLALLVLLATGYSAWLVVAYWDRVGV